MNTDRNFQTRLSKTFGNRWFRVIAATVGFGTALVYLWNSKRTDSSARARSRFDHTVDDRGTGQEGFKNSSKAARPRL